MVCSGSGWFGFDDYGSTGPPIRPRMLLSECFIESAALWTGPGGASRRLLGLRWLVV
jgi:hypothetical protein